MTRVVCTGAYTFSEAARLCRLKSATVRSWFVERKAGKKMVLHCDYPPQDGKYYISFLDLIDGFVAGHLKEQGVKLPAVRKLYSRLEREFDRNHPFCHESFGADGPDILSVLGRELGDDSLVVALVKRKVFLRIIAPVLKQVEYDPETGLAKLWRIADGVVLDPQRCAGAPIIDRARVLTYILAASYSANGNDATKAAWEYAVSPAEVMKAVRFETDLAA